MPTEDAYSSGHLVLSHFGTCKCSNVETNISWTCLVSGFLSFEHPSVLLFLLFSFDWIDVFYTPHSTQHSSFISDRQFRDINKPFDENIDKTLIKYFTTLTPPVCIVKQDLTFCEKLVFSAATTPPPPKKKLSNFNDQWHKVIDLGDIRCFISCLCGLNRKYLAISSWWKQWPILPFWQANGQANMRSCQTKCNLFCDYRNTCRCIYSKIMFHKALLHNFG